MHETTLTTAAVKVVVVVTLAATFSVSPTSAGPIKCHSPSLIQPTQLPESPSTDIKRPVEIIQRQHHHRLTKRSYVDGSCKGLYSRSMWDKLSHVCKDCQNLFRTAGVEMECRSGCFASDTFAMCLRSLYLPVNEYLTIATSLRGS